MKGEMSDHRCCACAGWLSPVGKKQILTNQSHVGTPSAHPVLGAVRPLPDGAPSLIRLAFIHSLDAINGIIERLRQSRRSYR